MISHKPVTDAPVITTVIGIMTIVSIPVMIYLLFSVWPESLARQVVATAAICCMIGFLIIQNKYEALLLTLLFLSQFQVSLHSFDLAPPVKLQILLCDVIITLFILVAIERRQPMHLDKIAWLFLLLIGWFAVAAIFSAHTHKSLVFIFWQIKYFILYVLASNTKLSNSLARRIVYVFLGVILIQGVIAFLQMKTAGGLGLGILGEPETSTFSKNIAKGSMRVAGTIGAINTFAGYMALILVFLFPFVLIRKSLLLYLCFGFGLVALILPFSRAGWLSFFAGCSCVVFMIVHARLMTLTRVMLYSFLAALILIVGIATYFDKILFRFQDKEAISSAAGRIEHIDWTVNVIQKYPLVGIGPGVSEFFGAWNNDRVFIQKALPGVDMPNKVHSMELQVWLETGTLGLLVFLVIIGVTFLSVFRDVNNKSESETIMCLRIGGTCAAVTVMVHASFGCEFSSIQIFEVFWVLLGLARNKTDYGLNVDKTSARHQMGSAMTK